MSPQFATRLLRWFDVHGRHDLPWQHPRTPYRVWVSEVMLQQTQVVTVLGYFERFMDAFPALTALAAAPLDDVLALWAGLGYYSRARNLHRAAQVCVELHRGELPDSFETLSSLPGIGRSTAGAILAQAHGQRLAILDGNAKRVLARVHGVHGDLYAPAAQRELWRLSESQLPYERLADYTQALMDLGATVCTRSAPRCEECALEPDCVARRDDLTAQIPAARRARALPERSMYWLLICDEQHRVLLERRPPSGIWGGLWSLPEATDADAAAHAALVRHGIACADLHALPAIRHTFTHFRLIATPLHARVKNRATHIADAPDRIYVARDEATRYGCPKPVSELLARFWESH